MRRRLIALVVASTVSVALAFLIPMGIMARTLARDRALYTARFEAQALAPVLAVSDDTAVVEISLRSLAPGAHQRITVFLPDGRQVGAPVPVTGSVERARKGQSFSAVVPDGMEVLLPVATGPGHPTVVRVFVPDSELSRGVTAAWAWEAALGVTLILVATAMAGYLARRIVRPVTALADAAQALGEGDLGARVEPEGPPEIVRVTAVFNRLGGRVAELLAAERERVADLSHRLRTPLTVARLEAEALTDPEESRRLSDVIEELEEAMNAVLHQARRPVRGEDLGALADVAAVARSRAAFWANLAEDQERTLEVEVRGGPGQLVELHRDELEAALDALVGNVFTHTADGVPLRIGVEPASGGGVVVVVEDGGPGLDEALVARGVSGGGSTGLGLDIARRAAEATGGGLDVGRSRMGGARVAMHLGGPAGPAGTADPDPAEDATAEPALQAS